MTWTWWMTLLVIFAVLVLIGCIPVGVDARYSADGVFLTAKLGPFLQEEMAGMLHVVQIVGVVHNALNIALVIPHFHLCLEYVFAHHFLFFSY